MMEANIASPMTTAPRAHVQRICMVMPIAPVRHLARPMPELTNDAVAPSFLDGSRCALGANPGWAAPAAASNMALNLSIQVSTRVLRAG